MNPDLHSEEILACAGIVFILIGILWVFRICRTLSCWTTVGGAVVGYEIWFRWLVVFGLLAGTILGIIEGFLSIR